MLSTFPRAAATWRPVPVDGRRGDFRTNKLFANAFGLSLARTDQSAGNGQDTLIFVPKSPSSFLGRDWLVSRQPKNPRDGIFSREENSDALSPALAGRAAEGEGGGCAKKEVPLLSV